MRTHRSDGFVGVATYCETNIESWSAFLTGKKRKAHLHFGATTFGGFGEPAFEVLHELGVRQSREWYQQNKAIYEREVKAPLGALIHDVAAALEGRGVMLRGDPKRSQFRVHRDIRFAKDKRPYKTYSGAFWSRSGAKTDPGVLYFHLAPEGCFTAAAFHQPDPKILTALRSFILHNPDIFEAMGRKLAKGGLSLELNDSLTRLPRGFESADSSVVDALKLRSFVVRRRLTTEDVRGPALIETITEFAQASLPLLRFGWSAIDGVR